MRGRGMGYDTGFLSHGTSSRETFDLDVVRRELTIIRDDLHCTAVQITGGEADRLEAAARVAADLGLEVWFSPYPLECAAAEMLRLFVDCAERAERLRCDGADVVFVAGVELSLMNHGFCQGADQQERTRLLLADSGDRARRILDASARLNAFLRRAAAAIRERFGGRLTYAAIPFEQVDWSLFDVVTVELIRSAEVADRFREGVRALVAQDKPVAITGFGTATWRGASAHAPTSMEILEYDAATAAPVRLRGRYARDEAGQARYLDELLEIFESEGVDSAFVFLFALYDLPHRPEGDPAADLDLASVGIVKVLDGGGARTYPGLPWEPKAAFATVARRYAGFT